MRIIAGKHGSRKLQTLNGEKTRPTSDKIKGAVFSSLGGFFDGGVCLDLFSGSGSIALEAISRGMQHAYCVDVSVQACQVIKRNTEMLNETKNITIYQKNALTAIKLFKEQQQFDFIYVDPPYKLENQQEIISILLDSNLLKENGYLVLEALKETKFRIKEDYKVVKESSYGITKIHYIQRR